MNKIYIAMVMEPTLINKLAVRVAGHKYSHVMFSLDGMRSFYGFRNRLCQEKLSRIASNNSCEVVEMTVSDKESFKATSELNAAWQNRHMYSYNLLGVAFSCFIAVPLFRAGFRFQEHLTTKMMSRPLRYNCAIFLRLLLDRAGIVIFDGKTGPEYPVRSPYFTCPGDFSLVGLPQVYEGTVEGFIKWRSDCLRADERGDVSVS